MSKFLIENGLTKAVWEKLRDGPVPLIGEFSEADIHKFTSDVNLNLASKSYVPNVVHGYLGLQKGSGVTRFLPILSKEDMAIYYHLCGYIGAKVLKQKAGIFGGWQSIPIKISTGTNVDDNSQEIEAFSNQEGYFQNTFSNSMWFDEFMGFTRLIGELTSNSASGAYVAITDIANFYDSIEIPRLISRLRRDLNGEMDEQIELLEVFLGLWDRRTTGYNRSSKGIPQEIISDGSRFLSHYYLQEFDVKFDEYCRYNRLRYVRWADDMMVFGPNTRILEEAIHIASRFLLPQGLNLNAHKTRVLRRTELAKYRGLDVLKSTNSSPTVFRRKLRSAIDWHRQGNSIRMDSIFRATLNYTTKIGYRSGTFEKSFIFNTVDEIPSLLGTLNDKQLVNLISIADDPKDMFIKIRLACLNAPYAGARANFLMLLRKQKLRLSKLGISVRLQLLSVSAVKRESADSEILQQFCIPLTVDTLLKS